MKQILTLRCVFFADDDLSANSSQRVPPCFAALPGRLIYVLFDSLYGMLTPDFERTSANFWLLHWPQHCDMSSIKGVSTLERKPGASTDLGAYNTWRSDL